jgi:hypothetical protein
MALITITVLVLVILLSTTIGSLVVYFDSKGRDNREHIWTLITAIGFIFGVLPGIAILASYLVISRRF